MPVERGFGERTDADEDGAHQAGMVYQEPYAKGAGRSADWTGSAVGRTEYFITKQ